MTGINLVNKIENSPLEQDEKNKTKEEHLLDYAKALKELDDLMMPLREHRGELKKLYKESGWLTKSELTEVAKAFRMLKSEECIENISKYYDLLKTKKLV